MIHSIIHLSNIHIQWPMSINHIQIWYPSIHIHNLINMISTSISKIHLIRRKSEVARIKSYGKTQWETVHKMQQLQHEASKRIQTLKDVTKHNE